MKIGFIGLGKMGYNMASKLLYHKHSIVACDRDAKQVIRIQKKGAIGVRSIKELVENLPSPKIVWLMIPHQAVDATIAEIVPLLKTGDILIDGGNSNYNESVKRSKDLAKKGIKFMDIGVSGGLVAAKTGYCMMVGGDKYAFNIIEPIIRDMCVPSGYGYFGSSGAGHYVKMVHNAIEYGMMEAIGEGMNLIQNGPYPNINQVKLTDVWNNGSIIRSFLMEMTNQGLQHHPEMKDVDGFIDNTGEGRWSIDEAKKYNVPVPVIATSLDVRLASNKKKNYGTKIVAVMRDEFGGHGIAKK